jgi:hypothetical protein
MARHELSPAPAAAGHSGTPYAYPPDLARFVRERWRDVPAGGDEPPPDAATLEHFFSACYQASLLREEERPVTFRAILAAPARFADRGRPPESLERLEFSRSFPFDAAELRRLSVATDTERTLIGVRQDREQGLRIWGLIISGTRWLRNVQGGRRAGAPLPPVPVVHVDAPGSLSAHKGYELVARLQRGRLSGSRADPFESAWLPEQFVGLQEALMARHETAAAHARAGSGETWAPLEPALPRRISERMMKRVISVLRDARHGGTIVFVPDEKVGDLSGEDPYIHLKYRFADGAPQRAFPDLVVDILNRLALTYARSGERTREPVGWREFERTTDDELATLDEALFETAHLIAGLASADGAVVLSKQHELLGFGGMISGRLPLVGTVARALDLEGQRVVDEETGNVGARHRSAYRLAGAVPGSVTIVISQDGGVRFIAWRGGRVTYWEQE